MPAENAMPLQRLHELADRLGQVVRGQERGIRLLLVNLVSGGHVLLEDYPGTGKTTLAKAMAQCLTADFRRIQFTPDLLPTDILGVSVYDQSTRRFEFRAGPIFSQILLLSQRSMRLIFFGIVFCSAKIYGCFIIISWIMEKERLICVSSLRVAPAKRTENNRIFQSFAFMILAVP